MRIFNLRCISMGVMAIVLAVAVTSTAALAQEPHGGKKNYMSFALGGYSPSDDLDDEGYKSGGDFSFNYMHVLTEYLGFGGSVHTYGKESDRISADIGDGDFGSIGIEGLLYVQPLHWRVQPYVALGPGLFFNGLEYKRDVDEDKVDESGTGFGFILELGVRAFVTPRFFGGFSIKGFSNRWNVEIADGRDETYDFGGGVMAFVLGFTF